MSLRDALDTLAAIDINGIKRSYTLADLRGGNVNRPDLPCLIPLPFEGEISREAFGFQSTSYVENHQVRHRCLVRAAQPANMGEAFAAIADVIDSYAETLQELNAHSGAGDMMLDSYEQGALDWGGIEYYGVDFIVSVIVSD